MKIIQAAFQVFIAAFIVASFFSTEVLARPSVIGNAHPHNSQTVRWEFDLIRDGNTAHNHFDFTPFFGPNTLLPPATAAACWDNQIIRVADNAFVPIFLKGHCFVNLSPLIHTPNYYLSSGIPSEAKDLIRNAFSEYNQIDLIEPGYSLGAGFNETAVQSEADVIVEWFDLPASQNGGLAILPLVPLTPVRLRFDSSMANVWNYSFSTSSVPEDKWHFYSVALHEVGHVFGLGHQPAGDLDDIMNAPVGEPIIDGGRQFSYVDDDSIFQIARLYAQPVAVPAEPEYKVYWQTSCWGSWDWAFTLNEVFSSGGLSYRPSASQWLCWAIAVIGP